MPNIIRNNPIRSAIQKIAPCNKIHPACRKFKFLPNIVQE